MRVSELHKYRFQYSLRIGQDLVIPKANHAEALAEQMPLSLLIRHRACRVLATVKLYDQMPLDTTEVDKKRTDRILTAKLCAVQAPRSQPPPQFPLGIGLAPPQATRQQRIYPLPQLERSGLRGFTAPSPRPSPLKVFGLGR